MTLDERLEKVNDKLDSIKDHISSIDITLARQADSLAYHIKRTDLLEAKLEPMTKKQDMMHGVIKFVGFLAILAGILEGIATFLEYLKV